MTPFWWADSGLRPNAGLEVIHVSASSQSLRFILSLRLYSSFISSRPGWEVPKSFKTKLTNVSKQPIIALYFESES